MISRFIKSIRRINHVTGFESYLEDIQRGGKSGTVNAEEAKKDYRNALRSRERALLG